MRTPLPYLLLFTIIAAVSPSTVTGQDRPGPHEEQSILRPAPSGPSSAFRRVRLVSRRLTHSVFGYHPYWMPEPAAASYRYDLLSHVAYFACEVNPATGEPSTVHDWMTTAIVDSVQAHGGKALLAATCFGAASTRQLLQSQAARDTLIERLIGLVGARSADGVNIDFEAVPADARDQLSRFFLDLRQRLDAAVPNTLVTAATPAVDWSGSWDLPLLGSVIDLFFVMGYDYSWSASTRAGPVAPIQSGSINVTATVDWYLAQGVPPGRLILGVPYYGYDWPVSSDVMQAETTGRGTARVYATVQDMLMQADRQWSDALRNPWFSYQSQGWRQVWYDDAQSLAFKYDLVLDRGLAGPGIWALGYDAGHEELWSLLEDRFTLPTVVSEIAAITPRSIQVFPQPASRAAGALQVRIRLEPGQTADLVLFDILGRRRNEGSCSAGSAGDARLVIDVAALQAGTYVLAVTTAEGRAQRLITVR